MKIRTQTILLEVGVFFAGLFTLGVGAFLVEISHDVAWVNPTITYMRVPVLLIAWAFLAFVLAALVLARRQLSSNSFVTAPRNLVVWLFLPAWANVHARAMTFGSSSPTPTKSSRR